MIRKLLYFISTFIFVFVTNIYNFVPQVSAADAVTCSVPIAVSEVRSPAAPNDTDKEIRLRIDVGQGTPNQVALLIKAPGDSSFNSINIPGQGDLRIPMMFDVTDGKIEDVITRSSAWYFYEDDPPNQSGHDTFKAGSYTLAIAPQGSTNNDNAYCTIENAFTVTTSDTGPDNFCAIHYGPSNNYTIKTDGTRPSVKITVDFPSDTDLTDDSTHLHYLYLDTGRNGTKRISPNPTTSQLKEGLVIPYEWSIDFYKIRITEHAVNLGEGRSCISNPAFEINTEENDGGGLCDEDRDCGEFNSDDYIPGKVPLACEQDPLDETKFTCNTALGKIGTDPQGFARSILTLVLGLAGGILLLLFMINGYKFMVSQGDPEKIKDARDGIIAAVAGILLIIFALTILRIITVDVLGIPGFG